MMHKQQDDYHAAICDSWNAAKPRRFRAVTASLVAGGRGVPVHAQPLGLDSANSARALGRQGNTGGYLDGTDTTDHGYRNH